MRRLSSVSSIVCLLALSPVAALAQNMGPINAPQSAVSVLNPGQYGMESFRKDPLYIKHLDQMQKLSAESKVLYQQTIADFFEAFKDLQEYSTTLINRANSSVVKSGDYLRAEEYLSMVQEYQKKKSLLETRLGAVATFTQGLKGQLMTESPGMTIGKVQTITAAIDFQPLADKLQASINLLETEVRKKQIVIVVKSNPPKPFQLLSDDFVKFSYDAKEVAKIRSEIAKNQIMSYAQQKTLTAYSNLLIQEVHRFITAYGTQEAWRANTHGPSYEKAKRTALEAIVDGFWQRSYLRQKYGINLGSISMPYKGLALGFDNWFKSLKNLTYDNPSFVMGEVTTKLKEVQNFIKTTDSKSKTFRDILDGKVGALDSANSIITTILGQDQVALAMVPVLGLMLNDLYEEVLMHQGKRDEMIERYTQRYLIKTKATNGRTVQANTLIRELQLDYNQGDATYYVESGYLKSVEVPMGQMSAPAGSLMAGAISAISVGIERTAEISEAARLQESIQEYIRVVIGPQEELLRKKRRL